MRIIHFTNKKRRKRSIAKNANEMEKIRFRFVIDAYVVYCVVIADRGQDY